MFVFSEEPQVTWPVKVQQPMDGGTVEERRFQARFRILRDDARVQIGAGLHADDGAKALLRATVTALEGVIDGQGKPVPFTPEVLEAFINVPFIFWGLMKALSEVVNGKAAEGNSERPAEPGS